MGYIRHDAIIVTGFDKNHIRPALNKAEELGLPVSGYVKSTINSYVSFLIAPDGSKEGWEDSRNGEEARDKWIEWAVKARKRDIWLDWVHVSYGGDEAEDCKIIDTHFNYPEDS